ncbi:uncharacterized protein RAG0_02615 [Rhynchosporium agropyri]|uniref:Uncharacterized protein n=1 Tax=Rhynchosporium agropyri TaxID=914238 RepID=A0A1E1K294_9HELO|nr:uncharacterized protein RAG0_02615 [Rhynchosporium agropyri]
MFLTPSAVDKPMRIEHHQPRLVPTPIPEPQEGPLTRGREWTTRTKSFASRASSRGSFSVRRKLNAYNGPRRPRIGHPSNFQHLENAAARRAPGQESFRPLELSIYMPENQLSPMLPHFGNIDDLSFPSRYSKELPFPPPVLVHSRSDSAMSFCIPRKPVRSCSGTPSEWSAQFRGRPGSLGAQELLAALERPLPQAPAPARLRAKTEPPNYERVKSALHERYELEQRLRDIEEIIEERKSIYFNSRPNSRLASRPASIYSDSQEPMPAPRLLAPFDPTPQMDPSFAERVSSPLGQRPEMSPSKTVHIPSRLVPFTEASATFTSSSPSSTSPRPARPLPPPPLPLVLQATHPPLRKKRSFSRVSNWLFPASGEHSRNISLDSVTNTPKPLTSREGFYQCVDLIPAVPIACSNTLSTVSTLESELDEPTIPTSCSPNSSPGTNHRKQQDVTIRELSMDSDRNENSIELTRVRTFGEKTMGDNESWRMEPMPGHVPGRNSVGVAF